MVTWITHYWGNANFLLKVKRITQYLLSVILCGPSSDGRGTWNNDKLEKCRKDWHISEIEVNYYNPGKSYKWIISGDSLLNFLFYISTWLSDLTRFLVYKYTENAIHINMHMKILFQLLKYKSLYHFWRA